MNNQSVTRDERTAAVENTSYRIAYLVMSFGLLVCIAYRGFVLQQSSWDLLALVILGDGKYLSRNQQSAFTSLGVLQLLLL